MLYSTTTIITTNGAAGVRRHDYNTQEEGEELHTHSLSVNTIKLAGESDVRRRRITYKQRTGKE